MKRYINLLTLVVILSLSFRTITIAQEEDSVKVSNDFNVGKMIVQINGLSSNHGLVLVALNNSRSNFEDGTPFKRTAEKISENKVQFLFEEVPFGEYAIKCYHDENMNGQLDKNMFGMPTESYGYSNDARGNMGPADYSDAKFLFKENNQVVKINMQ
jgi:uncharacterized protein (DUF2141 family)